MAGCFIVTVDGPSAAGKGTIAKQLAEALGFDYLDTGLMYRMLGYEANMAGISEDDIEELVQLAGSVDYSVASNHSGRQVIYQSEEIGRWASVIACMQEVRQVVNLAQRNFPIGREGVVIDGRDIGSVIFPQAECKLYITADQDVRAMRRFMQMQKNNTGISIEAVKEKLRERDERDTMRCVCPLVVPTDAIVLDTSLLSVEESFGAAYNAVQDVLGKRATKECNINN